MGVLKTEFGGDRGDLLMLALKTGLLTVFSFGLYRFWQTTRLRRWYWSSIRPGGTPLEYTGMPQEKLMGFLVAVIVLAVYLVIFNLCAIFVAVRLSEGARGMVTWAIGATPLALVPVIFVARYRARRYIMARTRWRGIRFGMEPGAFGYAWRACMYWTLSILSLGLLWPMKAFQLEKYLTDRSWFGNARFTQSGHFGMLFGPAIPFIFGIVTTIGLIGYAVMTAEYRYLWWLIPTILMIGLGAIYFRVATIRVLTGMKSLGDGMAFDLHPRTRTLLRIHVLGNLLAGVLVSFVSPVVLGLVLGVLAAAGQVTSDMIFNPPPTIAAIIGVLTWVTVFVLFTVFRQVFVVYPTVRHIAVTLRIDDPEQLQTIRQRRRDAMTDAGGFAEALDVGAAF